VGLSSTFGNPTAPTPHGGEAFHGWKNGYGFGKAPGPGGYNLHPGLPMPLRFTPSGDRCYAATSFWRGREEVGQASSFGIGDRPDYGNLQKAWSVSPDNYGDISRQLSQAKKNVTRRGISLKPRFPTMEEKYRDLSWPKSGPGPGKYDTRIPAGTSSWKHPVHNPAWSMGQQPISRPELRQAESKPGPSDYSTRMQPGKRSPIQRGTIYDVGLRGRLPSLDTTGDLSPGPAKYTHKEGLAKYGLWEKISNVKARKYKRANRRGRGGAATGSPEEGEEQEVEEQGGDGTDDGGEDDEGERPRALTRVESSPA